VSAELTNQPSPAIFHRQSRCMPASGGGLDNRASLRNGDAAAAASVSARRGPVARRNGPQSLQLRYDSNRSIPRR